MPTLPARLYSTLVESDEDHGCGDLPETDCREVPGNAARLVGGFTLQKIGDRLADPKTVLAWMLTSLGAPPFATALLVPIRESGSLLPQVFLVPIVRRFPVRSRVWAVGAGGQAIAVAAIGVAALLTEGVLLGVLTLVVLGIFALMRSVSSITAKDVVGKTIPKGQRGSVTGIAAAVAGSVAIAAGIVLFTALGNSDPAALALVVTGSALLWVAAGLVFLTVDEAPGHEDPRGRRVSMKGSFALFVEDAAFRRFVIARSLMLATALSPPYVVALSAAIDETSVSGVGPFVVATGIAGLVASPLWGRLADRSSRQVMVAASASAGVIIVAYLASRAGGLDSTTWLGPLTYLLLALAHAGARMGRKTYVVDMARGERRTSYVATSNTIIGVVLLAMGLLGAAVSELGPSWALGGLAAAGFAGALVSLTMDEVERED